MIDDEPLMTRFVAQSLKRAGFENVVCLNNPQDALAEISRLKPDLVLLDIVMPEIDGYTLCRKLQNYPALATIPMVFASAQLNTEEDILNVMLSKMFRKTTKRRLKFEVVKSNMLAV